MAARTGKDESTAKPKYRYQVKNWAECDRACLTLKNLFRLPYQVTEGLLKSLMRRCALDLPVADHSHLSRRAATLEVKIPRRPRTGAPEFDSQTCKWRFYMNRGSKTCTTVLQERKLRWLRRFFQSQCGKDTLLGFG